MVVIASSGIHFKDPRRFYRAISASSQIANISAATTAADATAAGFFTEQVTRGVADNSNWVADTYKTLLSISSGMGLVSHLIGPTGLAGTPTTTFEITVDGVLYTVPVVATTITQRAILGAINTQGSTGISFTTAKAMDNGADSISADKTTQKHGGSQTAGIWPWTSIHSLGIPCLTFSVSLLIRAKSSESNSTTTNQERQSAVQYMVMG